MNSGDQLPDETPLDIYNLLFHLAQAIIQNFTV